MANPRIASSLGTKPSAFQTGSDQGVDAQGTASTAADFVQLAEACRQAAASMAAPALPSPPLRLFSTWEITRYMIPVAQAYFRRVIQARPELPQGRDEAGTGARWFSLQEVLVLRAHFAAQGARSKTYLPYRPQAAAPDSATAKPQAKITVVAHAQAGVGKTTTCVHLAMSAALEGYRVLVIDMDAQARLTALFKSADSRPDQSVFALLASHYAQQLRADNQRRLDRGETPQALDTALSAALKRPTQALIRATHWPNIDLIAADMSLSAAEFQLADWRLAARGWPFWAALRETLARDGVLDAYDLIFIDTPPALGQLTLMAVASADIVLVPTAATAAEVAATAAFFDLLHRSFQSLEQGANLAARALGQPDLLFDWGAVRLVLTRYQAVLHSGAASLLHSHLGSGLTPQRQDFTALLDQAGAGAVYEIDYRAFNRETYARARESFDGNYDDFKALLHACWQRDMQG